MRRMARDAERSFLRWVLFFLVAGGAVAIALTYGTPTALISVICLLAGGGTILVLYLVLTAIEYFVNRDE